MIIYLMVEPTYLQNMLVKLDDIPQVEVNLTNIWNHHLVMLGIQNIDMLNNPLVVKSYFLGGSGIGGGVAL